MKTSTPAPTRRRRASTAGAGGQLAFWEEPVAPAPEPKPERKPRTKKPKASPEVARQVGEEILCGDLNPADWASALAETGNSDGRAIAEYARRRIEELDVQMARTERKEQAMEIRRRHSCGPAPTNTRRLRIRRESPSLLGLLLIFLGIWGLSAAYHVRFRAMDGTPLYWISSLSAVALCAMLLGGYFLSGQTVQRFFAGARTIGIGFMLCGISLFGALSLMFQPGPARGAVGTAAGSVPVTHPAAGLEMMVPQPAETPPMSSR